MKSRFKRLLRSPVAIGSFLNIASVFVLSICGLGLYYCIIRSYGAYTLGLFNLIFSLYLIIAQLGNIGIQVSALIHVARHSDNRQRSDELISAAIIPVVSLATVITLAVFFLRYNIASFFKNDDIPVAIMVSCGGLWCAIINRLFLSIINGFNKMKAYAMFRSFRYVALLVGFGIVFYGNLAGNQLPLILTVSEGLLLLGMLFYTKGMFSFVLRKGIVTWIRRHVVFGSKAVVGQALLEINTRIDILMLGYFFSETVVGIYSFVAVIIEGINQFPAILTANVSPVFTKLITQGQKERVKDSIYKGTRMLFPVMVLVGILAIALYPVAVAKIIQRSEFVAAWSIFSILMIGSVVKSTYAPFVAVITQSGHPGMQTLHTLATIMTNVILNLILIPPFEMAGAALATAISFIASVGYLKLFVRSIIKIRI